MICCSAEPMLLVASRAELPAEHRVWGTGGWLPPESREALDWLTFSRLHGWGVTIAYPEGRDGHSQFWRGSRWIVIACNLEHISESLSALIESRLSNEPLLVIAPAGAADAAFARLAGATRRSETIGGRSLRWSGPGPQRSWSCRKALKTCSLEFSKEVEVWASLDSVPVVVARRIGRGVVATLGFHASEARDTDGAFTALLRHLLIYGSAAPVAWFDFSASLVLRMDDPGGAQNVYKRNWCYPKLGEAEWAAIGTELTRKNARLSLGYVAAWVDDGDLERGTLTVVGQKPPRVPGRVYPSPLVRYRDRAGHTPGRSYDYESEFRGIQRLRAAGLADVELHGYTHMHPDTTSWAKAPDRYEATDWFRELGKPAAADIGARSKSEHPLTLGIEAFRRYFSVRPTTLICPGDEWTNGVMEHALDLGLQLVESYYLAIRDNNRFCWATHVCAPYLNEPDVRWFDAGLPVVGYFHDYEPALEGVAWISKWLDRWRDAGAQELMDFRQLAAAVARRVQMETSSSAPRLTIDSDGAPALVRPLQVNVRFPESRVPSRIAVSSEDGERLVQVQRIGHDLGRVTLPCSSAEREESDN